ncbi:DUF4153 domain-containing protein [Alcaligenes sp. AB3]|uniref:DUF4153 domain-containing protein n=1 Tax=Alcaligenes sp. AB3 TaxID=2962569 RepID=UPI002882A7C7|nr:DUF4153 domain-containing protein [Alcaligenes sp. AB3]MDT0215756.1 DUF4153 domain-containing protein [Alcaligenes sp. AB3]
MTAISLSSLQNRRTLTLCLAGAVLGLLEWVAFSNLMMAPAPREHIWVSLLLAVGIFGVASFTLLMHISVRKALLVSLGLGVASAALILQAQGGYAEVALFWRAPQMWVAMGLLATITLPFLAILVEHPRDWADYRRLFELSWSMVCSWAVALFFCGLAWGVLMACHMLLSFVGIPLLGDVLLEPTVAAVVSGALVGAGLALASDSDGGYLSPILLLKLLRLLTPVLLVVMVVFIVALPWRTGDGLPLAALCVAAVLGASTLVSSVVADEDTNASATPLLRASARLLGFVMPVLAGVALWAIGERVAQYGWTPIRVLVTTAALVAAGYGLSYFWASCHPQNWMARVRRSNVGMALVLIVLAIIWLLRIGSPEAISAASQVARLEAGTLSADDFPDTEMRMYWGLPGQRAMDYVVEKNLLLSRSEEGSEEAVPDQELEVWNIGEDKARQMLLSSLPSSPADHPLRQSFIETYPGWDIAYLAKACETRTPGDHAGCLLVFVDLLPDEAGDEAIVLSVNNPMNMGAVFVQTAEGGWEKATGFTPGLSLDNMGDVIDGIHAKGAVIEPAPFNVLTLPDGGFVGAAQRP